MGPFINKESYSRIKMINSTVVDVVDVIENPELSSTGKDQLTGWISRDFYSPRGI